MFYSEYSVVRSVLILENDDSKQRPCEHDQHERGTEK